MKMRWILTLALVVLCACSFRVFAQTAGVTGIGHVAFRVSDLDKEIAFLQKLGYEESFGFPTGGKINQVFVKINDREFVEIYQQTDPAQPLGWMHVCYESDDINALKAAAGNLIFSLKDPEGRVTEFTQYMPGSRHWVDRGSHLGAHRVSQELLGFELPVPDVAADKQFYTAGLGFAAMEGKAGLKVQVTHQPYPWIELHSAKPGDAPQLLFRVPDAGAAARQLSAQGLAITQTKKRVSVSDPDGNVFAFVEDNAR
jgi:catechol 2,3-dioxygenase-like lactoylglutathione lyase family enzyme